MLQKSRAVKVRRLGVGHAARMGRRIRHPFGDAARRLRHDLAVGIKSELGHPPRRFHAVHRLRKINARGRLADGVDVGKTRQRFGKRAKQQSVAAHGQKVFTVDPYRVHRAVGVAARLLLGTHAFHHLGGVSHLHMLQLHAVLLLQLSACPLQVSVDAFTASPGVEVNRLSARGFEGEGPVGGSDTGCLSQVKPCAKGGCGRSGQKLSAIEVCGHESR